MRKVLTTARNLALVLVAIEIVLQVAGFAGRFAIAPDLFEAGEERDIVILAVGDSHTWGAGVDPKDSYPSQLQRALAQRFPSESFRVINLGIPGINSAFVANRLERQILQIRPNLVIVWVGINNLWNVLETESRGAAEWGTTVRRMLLHSKLFRLAMVSWHSRSLRNAPVQMMGSRKADPRTPDEEPQWFWKFGEEEVRPVASERDLADSEIIEGLDFDYRRIVQTARSLGTPLLFINYHISYRAVLAAISANGERLGVTVVESIKSTRRAHADGHRPDELLVEAAGPHPSGLLYRYVVEDLMPEVIVSLETEGKLELAP